MGGTGLFDGGAMSEDREVVDGARLPSRRGRFVSAGDLECELVEIEVFLVSSDRLVEQGMALVAHHGRHACREKPGDTPHFLGHRVLAHGHGVARPIFHEPFVEHAAGKGDFAVGIHLAAGGEDCVDGGIGCDGEQFGGGGFVADSVGAEPAVAPRLRTDPLDHFASVVNLVLVPRIQARPERRPRSADVDGHDRVAVFCEDTVQRVGFVKRSQGPAKLGGAPEAGQIQDRRDALAFGEGLRQQHVDGEPHAVAHGHILRLNAVIAVQSSGLRTVRAEHGNVGPDFRGEECECEDESASCEGHGGTTSTGTKQHAYIPTDGESMSPDGEPKQGVSAAE